MRSLVRSIPPKTVSYTLTKLKVLGISLPKLRRLIDTAVYFHFPRHSIEFSSINFNPTWQRFRILSSRKLWTEFFIIHTDRGWRYIEIVTSTVKFMYQKMWPAPFSVALPTISRTIIPDSGTKLHWFLWVSRNVGGGAYLFNFLAKWHVLSSSSP